MWDGKISDRKIVVRGGGVRKCRSRKFLIFWQFFSEFKCLRYCEFFGWTGSEWFSPWQLWSMAVFFSGSKLPNDKAVVNLLHFLPPVIRAVVFCSRIYAVSHHKSDPVKLFCHNFSKIAFNVSKNWCTQPVYDIIKLQYCKTVVHLPGSTQVSRKG